MSLRPRQWSKNLLLFAAILFAAELGDVSRWVASLTAFAAYCAASSAAYLVNDVHDAGADRRHPVKRSRPVARGELSPGAAHRLAAGLAVGALGLASSLGIASVIALLGFLALQGLYTAWLREVVLVDVMVIAGLFVIRAGAGAVAIDVHISGWLLACTGLLALLLALGKRRAEAVGGEPASPTRSSLEGYSPALLEQLLTVAAAATVASYAVYAVTAHDVWLLPVTIPFVVYGVLRYLVLVHRRRAGEDPENILLTDPPTLATVTAWTLTCAVALQIVA